MKLLLLLLLSCTIGSVVHGQEVSYDEFRSIIPYLQQEDFKGAFEKTKAILAATPKDTSDLHGIVAYMNIFSSAGMVSLGQMTHDEFLKNAKKFTGKKLVMSAHPCLDSTTTGFNALRLRQTNGRLEGMTTTANNTQTTILCFEYFNYATPVDYTALVGKSIRCGGILKSVEVNPNKSTLWISRLYIEKAFARESTPR